MVINKYCKDRTLSYRTKNQPVFNGAALPVFSVDTIEEAKDLITLVGKKQYGTHPKLPSDQPWMKIDLNYKPFLEFEDLDLVSEKLSNFYNILKQNKT